MLSMEEYLPGALGLLWSQDRSALEVVNSASTSPMSATDTASAGRVSWYKRLVEVLGLENSEIVRRPTSPRRKL